MQFRSLLLLGICTSFSITASAFAASPPANEPPIPAVTEQTDVVQVASKTDDAATVKKKKLAAEAKAREKAKLLAKAKVDADKKLAAKAQAAEDKKLAAAAKAKEAEKARQIAQVKAEKEKLLLARAKAAEEKKIAKAKADEARKLAQLKAAEDRKMAALAKVKAAEDRRLALAKAAEDKRLAIAQAAEAKRQAEVAQLVSMDVARTGNNGELRSESVAVQKPVGLFAGLFGGSTPRQSMLPETRALDAVLEQKQAKKQFKVKSEFEPQEVSFTGYPRGTIVIDTGARFLYLVDGMASARRYAIAVGRDGLQYKGTVKVGDKQEWPRWIPTLDMQKREPSHYAQYKDGMPGGADNPLGARAIYLYENGKDTHLRIHGTNQPQSIGTSASNGCFRMINEHVMDLYKRVPMGTSVVVL